MEMAKREAELRGVGGAATGRWRMLGVLDDGGGVRWRGSRGTPAREEDGWPWEVARRTWVADASEGGRMR